MDMLLQVDKFTMLVPERLRNECTREGIDVVAAAQIFSDPNVCIEEWPNGGDCYTIVGRAHPGASLYVVKCCMHHGVMRLVSVRQADAQHAQLYEQSELVRNMESPLSEHGLGTDGVQVEVRTLH